MSQSTLDLVQPEQKGPAGELPVLIPLVIFAVCVWWIGEGLSTAFIGTGSEAIGLPHVVLACVAGVLAFLQLGIRHREARPDESFARRNEYSLIAVAVLLIGAVISAATLL